MKHKFLTALFSLVAVLCLCFGIAACGGNGGSGGNGGEGGNGDNGSVDHEHVYTAENKCKLCGDEWNYTEGLNYTYIEETDSYAVGENSNARGDVVIPYGYKGKFVTAIIPFAFEGCDGLTGITIPNSVVVVAPYAFNGSALYNDPNNWDDFGVLYIGGRLIKAKPSLTGTYTVREGTKRIEMHAFSDAKPYNENLCLELTEVIIPDSVISIGERAFLGCSKLKSISFPNHVKEIGEYVFYGCTELESVMFEEKSQLKSIGAGAFAGCWKLISITIPNSVTEIGQGAFADCPELTNIHFQGTVEEWEGIKKGQLWFNDTDDYTVTCTNGAVDKDGKVTMN